MCRFGGPLVNNTEAECSDPYSSTGLPDMSDVSIHLSTAIPVKHIKMRKLVIQALVSGMQPIVVRKSMFR